MNFINYPHVPGKNTSQFNILEVLIKGCSHVEQKAHEVVERRELI